MHARVYAGKPVTGRATPSIFTDERWRHVCGHHPEMELYEEQLRETIRSGKRRQDSLNPQKYRYLLSCSDLHEENTHVGAIVLFRFGQDVEGRLMHNNYIVTAYQKQIG
jgi:hypothetical protein